MSGRRRRDLGEVVVILWRDIPAQVNGQLGRDRHQVLLSAKFQRAVDRAKRKAGIHTAHEDVAQWRRESRPVDGDPAAEAEHEAARLEAAYSQERLGRLAFAGGREVDVDPDADPGADRGDVDDDDEDDEGAETPAADSEDQEAGT